MSKEPFTVVSNYLEHAVAGAVLAELLLDCRLSINATRKQLVVLRTHPTGDPILDECLEIMKASKRRASLQTWVSRLAGIKNLRDKVAQQPGHKTAPRWLKINLENGHF